MAVSRLLLVTLLLCLNKFSSSSPSPPLPRSSHSSSRIVFPGQHFRRESSEEEIDLGVIIGARDGGFDVPDPDSGERSASLHFPSSSEDEDELESEEVRRVRPQWRGRRKRIKNRNKNRTEEEEAEEEIIKQNDEYVSMFE